MRYVLALFKQAQFANKITLIQIGRIISLPSSSLISTATEPLTISTAFPLFHPGE